MISIVIPLYNKQQTICRCLQSIFNQSFTEYEILIINDGSTDDSIQIIKNSFRDERIVIVNKKNGGVSSARNEGLLKAKYDWVAFIDADDTWEPEYLEKMCSIIKLNTDVALCGSRQNFIYPNGHVVPSCCPVRSQTIIFNKEEYFYYARHDIMFHASAIIVNKQIINSNSIWFDTGLIKGEDLDFYFQIAFNQKMLLYNEILTNYYVDAPNSAMKRPCPLEKRLIGNIKKYFSNQNRNYTNQFLSEYILSCSRKLLREYGQTKEVLSILSLINVKLLPLHKKVFYYLPNALKIYF